MKTRPILFSAEMVKALLAGRKTQTRRVIKPQPTIVVCESTPRPRLEVEWRGIRHRAAGGRAVTLGNLWEGWAYDRCPYGISALYQGQPDMLYVKETYFCATGPVGDGPALYHYRADADEAMLETARAARLWKGGRFMPRDAARIFLPLKRVRVERLQEISEEDAWAEGASHWASSGSDKRMDAWCRATRLNDPQAHTANHRGAFRALWESIHGPEGWMLNPWVWVLEWGTPQFSRDYQITRGLVAPR